MAWTSSNENGFPRELALSVEHRLIESGDAKHVGTAILQHEADDFPILFQVMLFERESPLATALARVGGVGDSKIKAKRHQGLLVLHPSKPALTDFAGWAILSLSFTRSKD